MKKPNIIVWLFYFWQMEEKIDFEVAIFERRRSWYELLLASVFYSAIIYMVSLIIYYGFIETSRIIVIRACVTLLCPGDKINAGDIASFMVNQINDAAFIRKSPFITN